MTNNLSFGTNPKSNPNPFELNNNPQQGVVSTTSTTTFSNLVKNDNKLNNSQTTLFGNDTSKISVPNFTGLNNQGNYNLI